MNWFASWGFAIFVLFFMSRRGVFVLLLVFLVVCCVGFYDDANAAIDGTNKATMVLCDVILLYRGRIGRALSLIAIMTTAWGFILGHANWQRVSSLAVGFGLLFGAEGFAYIILPSTVKGISGTTANGKIFTPDKTYTPQEIVKSVCPELSRF